MTIEKPAQEHLGKNNLPRVWVPLPVLGGMERNAMLWRINQQGVLCRHPDGRILQVTAHVHLLSSASLPFDPVGIVLQNPHSLDQENTLSFTPDTVFRGVEIGYDDPLSAIFMLNKQIAFTHQSEEGVYTFSSRFPPLALNIQALEQPNTPLTRLIEELSEQSALRSPRTFFFLMKALASGVHHQRPRNTSQSNWEKGIFRLLRFCLSSKSDENFADEEGIAKQAVWENAHNTLNKLWRYSPPTIQKEFPQNELSLQRVLSLITSRRLKRHVNILLSEGVSGAPLLARLGLTPGELAIRRRAAQNFGIDIPSIHGTIGSANLATALRNATDALTIQTLLRQVPHRFFAGDRRATTPLLAQMAEIAPNFNVHPKNTLQFITSLRNAGIPVGVLEKTLQHGPRRGRTQRYYFIARQHLTRARQALAEDPALVALKKDPA